MSEIDGLIQVTHVNPVGEKKENPGLLINQTLFVYTLLAAKIRYSVTFLHLGRIKRLVYLSILRTYRPQRNGQLSLSATGVWIYIERT